MSQAMDQAGQTITGPLRPPVDAGASCDYSEMNENSRREERASWMGVKSTDVYVFEIGDSKV